MEMYFAVDSHASALIDQLTDSFRVAISESSHLSIYVLIDGAFEYTRNRSNLASWKSQAISLYAGTAYESLREASPHIILLSDDSEEMRQQLRLLLRSSNGMPMISFIASPLAQNALIESFMPFIDISVDNEQKNLLRFADTRILPVVDEVLCSEKIDGWRWGIAHWWLPDRLGNLTSLPECSNQTPFNQKEEGLALSQSAFNTLLDAGECDAIIDAIADQNPDLLTNKLPSTIYGMVHRLKEKLAEYRIESFQDAVMFCTTALATSEYFYTQKDFQALLKSGAWARGKLGAAFSTINDASWQEASLMNADETQLNTQGKSN